MSECPICGFYSCHCSERDVRRYEQDHHFDMDYDTERFVRRRLDDFDEEHRAERRREEQEREEREHERYLRHKQQEREAEELFWEQQQHEEQYPEPDPPVNYPEPPDEQVLP